MENKTKPTFTEQYNKIVNAYMKNELDPWNCSACFIGNLLNNNGDWAQGRLVGVGVMRQSMHPTMCQSLVESRNCVLVESNGAYTLEQVVEMETNFLDIASDRAIYYKRQWDEGLLFKAMESTLNMLKKIHEAHGEVVDQYDFKQREVVAI